jgi:hypothetical protein
LKTCEPKPKWNEKKGYFAQRGGWILVDDFKDDLGDSMKKKRSLAQYNVTIFP